MELLKLTLPGRQAANLYWSVAMHMTYHFPTGIGGSIVPTTYSTIVAAAFDTGTSLMMVPQDVYTFVLATVLPLMSPGSPPMCGGNPRLPGQVFCRCEAQMRPLTFGFPGHKGGKLQNFPLTLTTADLLSDPLPGVPVAVCRLNIMPSPLPMWILGDVVFRRVYAVHIVEETPRLVIFPRHHVTGIDEAVQVGNSQIDGEEEESVAYAASFVAVIAAVLGVALRQTYARCTFSNSAHLSCEGSAEADHYRPV